MVVCIPGGMSTERMELNVLYWAAVTVPRMTLNYVNTSMILLLIKLILIPQLIYLLIFSITKTGSLFNANSALILHDIFPAKLSWVSKKTSRYDGVQNKIAAADVDNADSERPEETNLAYFNNFHLEYNEATNILTFQEIIRVTISGGATNAPIFNSRFCSSITDLFQPKTSTFSTRALNCVHYRVVH